MKSDSFAESLLEAITKTNRIKHQFFECFASQNQIIFNKLIDIDKSENPNKSPHDRNKEILSYFIDFVQTDNFKKDKITDYYLFLNENFSGQLLGFYSTILWVSQPLKTSTDFMKQYPTVDFNTELFHAACELFRLYESFDPVINPEAKKDSQTPYSWLSKREQIEFLKGQSENFCALEKYFFTKKDITTFQDDKPIKKMKI